MARASSRIRLVMTLVALHAAGPLAAATLGSLPSRGRLPLTGDA